MANQSKIGIPKVKAVDFPIITNELPEITNLDYDLWTLRITLSFSKLGRIAYAIFKNVVGFRILDERNLLEFWNPEVRVDGWIWVVEKGGWFDLEKTRDEFSEGHINDKRLIEYLVLGVNDCVSVFTMSNPEIQDTE